MIVLQLILFCALFTLMVKIGVGNNALKGLFFYPMPVQEKVYELGLTDRETVAKKRKRFMIVPFRPNMPLVTMEGRETIVTMIKVKKSAVQMRSLYRV